MSDATEFNRPEVAIFASVELRYQFLNNCLRNFVKYVVFKHEKVWPDLCRSLTNLKVAQSTASAVRLCVMVSPSSLFRLFSIPGLSSRGSEQRHTGRVRNAMLSLLQVHGGHGVQRVAQRVRFADDLEALWYLRQDVLSALCELDGEVAARRQLRPINTMFKGRLPVTMGPRTHRLSA